MGLITISRTPTQATGPRRSSLVTFLHPKSSLRTLLRKLQCLGLVLQNHWQVMRVKETTHGILCNVVDSPSIPRATWTCWGWFMVGKLTLLQKRVMLLDAFATRQVGSM